MSKKCFHFRPEPKLRNRQLIKYKTKMPQSGETKMKQRIEIASDKISMASTFFSVNGVWFLKQKVLVGLGRKSLAFGASQLNLIILWFPPSHVMAPVRSNFLFSALHSSWVFAIADKPTISLHHRIKCQNIASQWMNEYFLDVKWKVHLNQDVNQFSFKTLSARMFHM